MPNIPMRRLASALALAIAAVHPLGPACAQTYPDKPIRFVVPFASGGGNELTARALADGMSRDLGQQVLIDIKPGAGTVVGTEYVATRPGDGYTILFASLPHSVNPVLLPRLPYDEKSLIPVTLIGRFPTMVVVHPERPFKTMVELIAHARAEPGKLNYGSFGNGTGPHLFPELLKAMLKIDITHIPYKGGGPAVIDLLGGRLDVIFSTASAVGAHIRSGKLRLIAVTSGERSPAYPDVPTVAEAGVPGYDAQGWYGIIAPAGTPPAIVSRLVASVRLAAQAEAFRKRAADDGFAIDISGPERLAALMRIEQERWRKVVVEMGIKPD